ncbi:MAG: ATPase, T2SS/T4P/T4SS family [Planctomycetota bacterium]|nr:ATPase, T2SS/T4P/T4SS family [Planctomycetota bacterium]
MSIEPTILAQHVSAFLQSPYKPFLLFLPFLFWAWLVSSKLDKDARQFHLNREMWNGIHLAGAAGALVAMLFVPIFWIGWPLGMVLLAAPILVYWRYRNGKVPEKERFYLTSATLAARMEARRQVKAARVAEIQFYDADDKLREVPLKEDPLFPVHMLAEDIIGPAVDARASMVELAVGQNGCAVSQLVDGIRYKREPVAADLGLKLVDYLKEIAGLDVEDRRRRQTAEIRMLRPSGITRIAMTTAGSSTGLVLRLEFDRADRLSRPFDDLGLLPSQIEVLQPLTEVHNRHGLVLIAAPPGQGLSTSMYSFLARHDPYTANIKVLEREVLLRIDGVDHVQWDPTNPDVDYATNLQSILRRDPDVVSVSLIRDKETARVVAEPGMQGPLIYIPQRCATIAEQIREWVKQVGDIKQATRALRAVVNQRLLRKLCANCRQSYQPTAEQLKKLNLPAGKVSQLYRAGGKVQLKGKIEPCPICGGSGYLGQTGIFEVLNVDDETRRLLAKGDLKAVLAHARRNKMIYLQEAALAKVASGDTSIEEVVRVTAPAKSEGGSGSRAPAQSAPAG